jgi:hypothetical protein
VHVITLHGKIANRRVVARCCLAQTSFNLSIHIAPTQILDIRLHLQRDLHRTALRELFPFSVRLLIRAPLASPASGTNPRPAMHRRWRRQFVT